MMLTPSYDLVTMRDPDSPAAEAFRILRTNISLRDFDKKIKVINVISAGQAESKTTTILNLGYVYSQLGQKVLVIDMDLRAPTIHKKLLVRNKCGLSDVIGRRVKFNEAVVHYTEKLDILLSGTKIPFAAEFIQSDMLKKFISELKDHYDMIFIDCPPINLVADGIVLSSLCDGTILCIASGKDEKKELEKVKETISFSDINILGIVMTRVPKKEFSYSNYSYGYHALDEKPKKKPKKKKEQ